MCTKVKFLMPILFILILFMILGVNSSYATTVATVEATVNYKNLDVNNEIFVTINIKEFQDIGDGINAYILTLNFDNDKLEFAKAEGLNGWNSPTYNSNDLGNGKIKFVATRSNFSKETGEILKITLKTKNNITSSDLNQISFKEVSFANKLNGNTQKLQVENIVLKLNNNNQQESQKQENTTEQQTEKSNKNSDTPQGPLPKTGTSSYIILFVILLASVCVFYKKYKNIIKGEINR